MTTPPHNTINLGDITLIRGDCLERMSEIPDNSVHMIFTDPPYGHNNNNNGDLISRWESALGKSQTASEELEGRRPIANDGEEANEVFRAILPDLRRVLVPGGCICCCGGGGGPDPQFARWCLWLDEVFDFKQMVVWDKGPMGMGWHYRRSYETVLVAMKPGARCAWYDESNAIENIIRPGYLGIKKIIPQADDHPTPKPVELVRHFIRLHSLPGETVLDPFAGGHSTAEAAYLEERNSINIEIAEEWHEYGVNRIRRAQAQTRMNFEGE